MKKITKRLTATALAIVMAVSSVTASAETGDFVETEDYEVYGLTQAEQNSMLDYAEEVLPLYLKANNHIYETCNLSYPVYIDNYPLYSVFIITEEDELIGELRIGTNEGEYYSSFTLYIHEMIKNFYENNSEVYLSIENGYFCALSDDNEFYSYKETVYATDEPARFNYNDVFNSQKTQKIEIARNIALNYSNNLMRASTANAEVEFVNNQKVTETGKYICWAACTAMAINKIKTLSLTAMDVYSKVEKNITTEECDTGYPDGCVECVKCSYSSYGYVCNNIGAPCSGSEVYYYISNKIPVQVNISTHSNPAASGSLEHAIIIEAVTLNQNSVVYSIVDPSRSLNPRHDVTVSVSPGTVSTSFVYSGYDENNVVVNYKYWYRTYR